MIEPDELERRRSAARRTALALGIGVAVLYAIFILSGVIGR